MALQQMAYRPIASPVACGLYGMAHHQWPTVWTIAHAWPVARGLWPVACMAYGV